jgi:acetyl-CoA synthetase
MSQKTYNILKDAKSRALIDDETYQKWYKQSIKDPEKFWGKHGKRIEWFKPYTKVKNTSFTGKVAIKWFEDGLTNVSYNCIDRHLDKRGDQVAIIWEGDNPYDDKKITYRELYDQVCRLANVMKSNGVKKGDRVTIYMPMIPEAAYAMLACTRIGAIHSIVFGGFSPDALAGRIVDCESTFVITADEGLRGGKKIPLKHNTDLAIEIAQRNDVTVKKVLVVQRTAGKIEWFADRDIWYHEATAAAKPDCKPAKMKAEDPLFILYTSGSTGKPKGVLHTTGGYLVYASMTHEYVFDYHEGDIYWCTADVGWVTGHSYIVYGPLANGATTLMFEGAELSVAEPFLGCGRQAQGQHLLHGAYGDPRTDGCGRRSCQEDLAQVAPDARVGRRADQPGSLGVVLQCRRREEVPDRRHLVADRDRRHPDHAAARRHQAEARFGDAAVLRRAAAAGGQ